MSAERTNRYRLNGAWSVALLAAVVILQAVAAQGGIRTGTVTSSSRTAAGGRKTTSVGMGTISNSRRVVDPVVSTGTSGAYFSGWGTVVENGTASLTMSVAIDQGRHVQKIRIPNITPNSITLNPGADIKKLADTLRIGDAVKFKYTIIGNRIYGTKISLLKRLSAESGAASFVFIGSKLVGSGKQKIMTVTANAGVTPCTFRVPEEVDDKGRPRPLAKVTDALKTFCRGDLLELEYKTVDYQFVLTGVKAARKSSRGVIVKVIDGKIKGYKHMGAMIKTTKRTLTLTDPEPVIELKLQNVTSPTPDPPVQTALKTLKPGDYVMFKYRRQRGVYWLDEIYATSHPESESESESSTHAEGTK